MVESVRHRAVIGTLWNVLQKFGSAFIAFISNMILARLLTPADFGCIAMLAVFIVIADTFVDSGLGSAVIQKKVITQRDLSTVFYFNFGFSIVLYGLFFACSPLIADFYGISILNKVLRVEGLVLVINSFSVVQTALLQRELRFKEITTASLVGQIIAIIIAICMAYYGFGVWALVCQIVIAAFVRMIGLWILSNWHPIWTFSKDSFHQLFGFGSFIFFSTLINNIGNNIQTLIIGKWFSAGILGYYSQAKKLEEIAAGSISGVLNQVTYPALAKKQDDKSAIVRVMRTMIKLIAYITFPIMIFLSITGKIIIPLCYGPQWIESIPMFQILCIAGLAICLQGVNYFAVAAIGKSKSLFYWTVIKRIIALVLILIGVRWGIMGLLIGVVFGAITILVCNAYQVQVFLKYSLWTQFKDLLPSFIITVISGSLLIYVMNFVSTGSLICDIVLLATVFIFIYVGLSHIFKLSSYKECRSIIDSLVHKRSC